MLLMEGESRSRSPMGNAGLSNHAKYRESRSQRDGLNCRVVHLWLAESMEERFRGGAGRDSSSLAPSGQLLIIHWLMGIILLNYYVG